MKRNIIYKILPDNNEDVIRSGDTGSLSVATASYIQGSNVDGDVDTSVSSSYISYSNIDWNGIPTSSVGLSAGEVYVSSSYIKLV